MFVQKRVSLDKNCGGLEKEQKHGKCFLDNIFNAKKDAEVEYVRLNGEKEKLRARIQQLEIDAQRQLELQRNKKECSIVVRLLERRQSCCCLIKF